MNSVVLTFAMLAPCLEVAVADLGADDYSQRQAASQALADFPWAFPRVEVARRHADPEIALRSRRLVRDFILANDRAWVMPRHYPVLPWIDQLPLDYPEAPTIVASYLADARKLHPDMRPGAPWPAYRMATQLWVRDLLLAGDTPEAIQDILDAMVRVEAEWTKAHKPSE